MARPLSVDLRRRVVEAYKRGEGTQVELAERFAVGEATVRRLVRRDRETGDVLPRTQYKHGPPPKIEMANMAVLEELLAARPDITNGELAELMEERTGISVSASTISRSIALLGWTRKKSASSPPSPMPRISAIFVQSGPRGRRG
jgi:transposase